MAAKDSSPGIDIGALGTAQRVQHQFNSVGDPELVEKTEHVVLHGVFT
jgi:hypothetical protein